MIDRWSATENIHLGDLVAPELHAHRMFGGRRKDIQDAAADSELAALAPAPCRPGVGELHQALDDVVEAGLDADGQRDRRDPRQLGVIGCNSDRAVVTTTASGGPTGRRREGEPATAAAVPRRFPRRAKAVRAKGFPGREHRSGRAECCAVRPQIVGLPAGGGDHQQRTSTRQRGGGEHPGRRRR